MTGKELRRLREVLDLSQEEMARALNQSYATVSRWERGKKEIPIETARLLECMSEVLDGEADVSVQEISEAVKAAGVVGVVVGAATSGLISRSTVAALAALGPFSWLGGLVGIAAFTAIPFFTKFTLNKNPNPWRQPDDKS